jgi:hypothetical protein
MSVRTFVRCGFVTVSLAVAQGQPLGGGISGHVRYPDGRPTEGAKVTAVTECEGPFRLYREATTASDGSYHIPYFSQECSKIRLHAEKTDTLWLRTGIDQDFYRENGSAPLVESSPTGAPAAAELVLGMQGGLLTLRVADRATHQFIWAELAVKRAAGRRGWVVEDTTGRDGAPASFLLPPGQFLVGVTQFQCGTAQFFVAYPTYEPVVVGAGQRIAKDIVVDVRRIKPAPSYANPSGSRCKL